MKFRDLEAQYKALKSEIDAGIEINPNVDPVAYHNAQNVYHVPTTPDGLSAIPFVNNRINYNEKEFNRLIDKRSKINI